MAAAAGDRYAPAIVAAQMRRTGARGPSDRITTSSRTVASARSGMSDTPTPAATKPWMAR